MFIFWKKKSGILIALSSLTVLHMYKVFCVFTNYLTLYIKKKSQGKNVVFVFLRFVFSYCSLSLLSWKTSDHK